LPVLPLVPLPPGPVPLPPLPEAAPAPGPPAAPARPGPVASEEPPRPGGIACRSPGPPRPATPPDDPVIGIAPAEAAGFGPEADSGEAGEECMTRIETVEKSRNAMAPPESTMTGRVLPAGCRR